MCKLNLSCGAIFRRKVLISSAVTASLAVLGIAGATDVSWVGPATGNWSLNLNWSGGVTPNNNSYDVFIDAGNVQATTVTLDTDQTIGSLSISGGDQLNIGNARVLAINGTTINNSGTIAITSAASNATFRVDVNPVTLTGGGVIVMNETAGGSARLFGTSTLTNSNNTIRGRGEIGLNTNAFVNAGTVSADVGGAVLNIDTVNAVNSLVNSGTMNAANGGILQLSGANGGSAQNTGTITALTGSIVQLVSGISIDGGTFATAGTGSITVANNNSAFLSNITQTGNLNIGNNASLNMQGASNANSGSISINAAANNTFLLFNGTQSLTGVGTIFLNQSAGGTAFISGSGTWTNSNTIRGAGNIGNNALSITNSGLILADSATNALTIDPVSVSGSFINTGTLLADGGILNLTGSNGGDFVNTGGRIIAASTDVRLVTNVGISGGTLSSTGAGIIRVPGGNSAGLASFTNTGNITLENNSGLSLNGGAITNNGSINVTSAANNTLLTINGAQSIAGTGTINLIRTGGGNSIITGSGSWTSANVIQGAGNIGNNAIQIINNKLIQATDGGNSLVMDPVNVSGGVTNNGTLLANGGVLVLTGVNGGDFINTGARIISGSTDVQLVTNASVTGGTLASTGAGAIRVPASNTASITSLTAAGVINVENNSQLNLGGTITNTGSINISAAANNSVLSVGSVLLNGGGTVSLGTSGASQAVVTGSATLTNANNFVRGSGLLGNNSISIINQVGGVVQADVAGAVLSVDPANTGTAAFRNEGVMRATNGGILQLTTANGGGFDNTGAGISAQTGSEVRLVTNASIVGGSLSTAGTGSVSVADGNDAYLDNVALSGNTRVGNNARMLFSNSLVLAGSLSLNSVANPSQFYLNGSSVAITGTGSILLNQASSGNAFISGTGTLTLSVPVSGGGYIGNNSLAVVNNSTITANVPGQFLQLDPANLTSFTNAGTILASGGTVYLTGANGGTFENSTGRIISASTDVNLIGGVYVNGGTFASTGAGVIRVTAGHSGQVNAIANTGSFFVDNSSDLFVTNTIANTGSISLNPIANNSRFYVNGGTVTLTGAGTVLLNTGTAGGVAQLAGTGTLINNQHIRGGGLVGTNSLFVINNGTMTADNPSYPLVLDPVNAAGGFTNNGTLLTTSGVLQLTGANGGDFDNTNGRIISGASDIQLFASASITGGTLSSTGAGAFHVMAGHTAFMNSLSTGANIQLDNNTDLWLTGIIANSGSINLNPVVNNARLLMNSTTVTLNGTGTVSLNTGTAGGTAQVGGTGTLISNQNIRGGGWVGTNSIFVINNSTMTADNPSYPLVFDPVNASGGLTNNGTLTATTGVLQLTGVNGGDFNNTNGRIVSGASDVQLYSGASITGGTLSSTGAGALRVMSGHTVFMNTLTNAGNIQTQNNTDLWVSGTITNTGSISLNAGANNARLLSNSVTVTLNGGGTVNLVQSGGGQAQIGASGTFTNVNNFIRGAGYIGTNSLAFVNNGTIQADVVATSIVIDPVNVAGGFTSNGVLRAMNGAQIYVTGANGGNFIGTGSVDVQANSFFTADTSSSFTNNAVTSNGTVTVQNSSAASIASLQGAGTLVINNSSQLTIRANGTQAGASKVISYTNTNSSKLDLNDNALVIDYTGAPNSPYTTVRSQIFSGYNNGSWNGNGIISTTGISDTIKAIGYAEAGSTSFASSFRGQSFAGGDAVLLMYTLRGDVNLDRTVNSMDFSALAGGYGIINGSATWSQGDFDYNGKVNTIDFNWLAGNFGVTLPAAGELPGDLPGNLPGGLAGVSLGSVVPEPASLSLLTLGLLGLRRRRR